MVGWRRRLFVGIAVAAAVVAAAVAVAVTSPPAPRDDLVVTPDPSPPPWRPDPPATAPPGAPPSAGGTWVAAGDAPVAPPFQHHGVWTGRELVVAGADALAAYAPTTGEWRRLPLPPEPLPDRVRALAWTGAEVLVVGTDLDAVPGTSRGLALELASGRWRTLAAPPVTGPVAVPVSVWTGAELVVWGLGETVAYDPAGDAWRSLERAPVPQRLGGRAAWTGSRLVVWGDAVRLLGRPFAAVHDAADGGWTLLDDPPLGRMAAVPAVWTGQELLLVTPRTAEPGTRRPDVGGLRLDPATGRWAPLPAPPWLTSTTAALTASLSLAWTGDRVVVVGGREPAFAAVHDPAAGTWAALPAGLGGRVRPVVAWTGDEVLVWGGTGSDGSRVDLVGWTPPR